MSKTYDSYAEHFGIEQADAIMDAAIQHKNGVHDNPGSDDFKWAVTIVIGYQCVEVYAKEHGITVPFDDFKQWVIEHGNISTHDGDFDYFAAMAGTYNEFIPENERSIDE